MLLPMLSTTDGTIILMSTPFDKSHFFYQAYSSPVWSRYHFKTSDNPLVTKEFLDKQREFLGERRFTQEHFFKRIRNLKKTVRFEANLRFNPLIG